MTKLINLIRKIKCPRPTCNYEWSPRVEKPKICPMCKQYLKYE